MKSVLISIKPKWCELIANGKKTVEVRKTRPKCDAPFKCFIYCTKEFSRKGDGYFQGKYCGKVIGEFVCDKIDTYDDDTVFAFRHEDYTRWNDFDLNRACIHPEDFQNYSNGKWLYGWHISDLVIYDKPKELEDFASGSSVLTFSKTKDGFPWRWSGMTRPPQSWCYVEESKE